MTIPKEVRVLCVTSTICVLIFSSGLLYRRKIQSDAQKIVQAKQYVSRIHPGIPVLLIEKWIKTNNFDFSREENNASNPFVYSLLANAKLSSQNVNFYLIVWSDDESNTFDNPHHSFEFFFDKKQRLIKAIVEKTYARSVSF